MKIDHNIERLNYLLDLYRMSADNLIEMINHGRTRSIAKGDIFSSKIEVGLLKRIDKIFNKGLHFYLDPTSINKSKSASIFFRKERFNSELSIGAIKIVNQFEEYKISLSAIAKLTEIKFDRKLPVYTQKADPKHVAHTIREDVYPAFHDDKKSFLKAFITKLAEKNILVFEFVETWNKKEKANIDGFFLDPNVIVIKRHQDMLRKEIFTLAHELGHYILNKEEIESVDDEEFNGLNLSAIERWCNDFAYYFLIGRFEGAIDEIQHANAETDYHHDLINDISKKTHLSRLALYTRLLYLKKISKQDYEKIQQHEAEEFWAYKEALKNEREEAKKLGKEQRGRAPIPIQSPLLISTIQAAFYEGVVTEFEVCRTLNIKPEKFTQFLAE